MLTTLSSGQSFSSYTVSDYATALSKTIGTTLSTSGTLSGNELLARHLRSRIQRASDYRHSHG
jgi:hypothetical protein